MPIFEYQAEDASGKVVNGTLLSPSLAAAATDLQAQGLHVLQLGSSAGVGDPIPRSARTEFPSTASVAAPPPQTEAPPTEARSKVMTDIVGPMVNKVALSHLLFFFRQLATMLKAGVGLIQSLDTLAGQTADPRLRGVIRELKGHAEAGRPISTGLQRYPEMFSPMIISMVRVGERGGFLEKSCRQISEYLDREIEIRNIVRRVTIYPKLVIGASILIILATNTIISSLGKSGGVSSILTQAATWFVLIPIFIGIFLFTRIGLQNPRIRYQWDEIMLSIPLLGKAVRQLAMAKFGRSFGTLYAGGVSVSEAIQLAADACGNEYMRARIRPVARGMEEGGSMTEAFRATGVLSPIVLDMMQTGETTGSIDEMLLKVAEFYEDEARVRSIQLATALGVVCLLIVGVYVAYTVISFYIGYFSGVGKALDQ